MAALGTYSDGNCLSWLVTREYQCWTPLPPTAAGSDASAAVPITACPAASPINCGSFYCPAAFPVCAPQHPQGPALPGGALMFRASLNGVVRIAVAVKLTQLEFSFRHSVALKDPSSHPLTLALKISAKTAQRSPTFALGALSARKQRCETRPPIHM